MHIAGFEVPETIRINGVILRLNGAAMRTKFFMNVYIVAFYTARSITREEEAIHSTVDRCMRMIITTPMATPGIVSENVVDGIRRSLGHQYTALQPTVDKIKVVIDGAKIGYRDYMDNYYSASGILQMYKNGQLLSEQPQSEIFATALFKMYMGKHPIDEKVKEALLRGHA
jgi:hypothetical protein